MKKIMLAVFSSLALSQPTFAHNRTIVCKDLVGMQEILRFDSVQGSGDVSTSEYDLSVKTILDDVRTMKLTVHSTQLVLEATRLEEILNASFAVGEAAPLKGVSGTRRGFAELSLGAAKVTSYERKGESRMELKVDGVNVLCEAIR